MMQERRARERIKKKEELARKKEEDEEKVADARIGFKIWMERKEEEARMRKVIEKDKYEEKLRRLERRVRKQQIDFKQMAVGLGISKRPYYDNMRRRLRAVTETTTAGSSANKMKNIPLSNSSGYATNFDLKHSKHLLKNELPNFFKDVDSFIE